MKELATYIVSISKLGDDDLQTAKVVETKLKELIDSEMQAVIDIVKAQRAEWGETAVRVNYITEQILNKLAERIITKKIDK